MSRLESFGFVQKIILVPSFLLPFLSIRHSSIALPDQINRERMGVTHKTTE